MARKKITHPALEATPRHLWLASLGLASMAGRQTVLTVTQTVERASQARRNAVTVIAQAQSRAIDTVDGLRTSIESGASRINSVVADVLAPLVAKFKPAKSKPAKSKRVVRRGRKLVAKTARRVTAKKVAKRTRRA